MRRTVSLNGLNKFALGVYVLALGTVARVEMLPSVERFRERLPDLMDALCPYNTICRDGQPALPLDQGKDGCCKECSCEESCGLNQNCCFPDQDVYNNSNKSHKQCIASSTDSTRRAEISFYMVVDRFESGSGDACGNENTSCGENEAATPIGSLYPVSSKTTGVIYKNEMCAECNGVDKTDQTPWNVVMQCYIERDGMLSTVLQTLETGGVQEFCIFDFYYPGDYKEVDSQRCYENAVHSCRPYTEGSYRVPEHFNMTDKEIQAACLSDFQAPYRTLVYFFNVFCYICNYGPIVASRQCDIERQGERFSGVMSFTAFVDPSLIRRKAMVEHETTTTVNEKGRTACKLQSGQKSNGKCRPVVCPSGQIRQGKACVHPTKELQSRNFEVMLKLYPREIIQPSQLEPIRASLQSGASWKTFLSAPRLSSWTVSAFCYHVERQDNVRRIKYFVVNLHTTKNPSSLKKLVGNVARFTSLDWTLLINGTAVALQPKFSEFKTIRFHDSTTYKFIPFRSWSRAYETFILTENVSWPLLNCLVAEHYDKGISITKTFLCDQVALESDEYILDKASMMLYVNTTDTLFFPAEFSVGRRPGGVDVPQLCLADAGYALVPRETELRSSVGLFSANCACLICVMVLGLKSLM